MYVYPTLYTWVCGESWLAIKDSLTHRPSSQGWASKCPLCIYLYILGTEGWVGMDCLSFLFFSYSILLLVCYTRVLSCMYGKGKSAIFKL